MAVKSIIDIDVNDAAFTRFTELFAKYQTALGKQADMWAKAGKSQQQVGQNFQKIAAQSMAQLAAQQGTAAAQKNQTPVLTQNARLWTQMSASTASVAKNLSNATLSLMKWAGVVEIVSGVMGIGGLFGLTRMASDVAGQRQTAMGRGVSLAEQSSMKNFSQLGLDESFLDTVTQQKSDPTKWSLAAMGIGRGGTTEETTVALLKAMRARALATSPEQLGLLDAQTGLGVGTNTWLAIKNMGEPEWNKHMRENAADSKGGIGDKTAQVWVDFNRQMQRAGQQIENIFANGLVKLEPGLKKLSEAFVHLTDIIINSKGVQDGIGKLSEWIDTFAKSIASGDFQNSVIAFINGIDDMATTIGKWLHPFDTAGAAVGGWLAAGVPQNNDEFNKFLAHQDFTHGLAPGTMEGVYQKAGGDLTKNGNPFGLSKQFADSHYVASRADPVQESSAIAQYLQDKQQGDTTRLPAAIKSFETDSGIHVEVKVSQTNTPGTNTVNGSNMISSPSK